MVAADIKIVTRRCDKVGSWSFRGGALNASQGAESIQITKTPFPKFKVG